MSNIQVEKIKSQSENTNWLLVIPLGTTKISLTLYMQ